MLFISRYCGPVGFAVKDTDDGVEECYTRNASFVFEQIVRQRLDVKGVVPEYTEFKMDDMFNDICVVPYQDESTVIPLQGKLAMMYGLKITLCDRMLTSLIWRNCIHGVLAEIKLSDLCDSIADNAFRGNTAEGQLKLVLLVDDNIKSISRLAFSPLYPSDIDKVYIDVSAVTDGHIANAVYSAVYAGAKENMAITMIQRVIRDRRERKERFVEKFLKIRGA